MALPFATSTTSSVPLLSGLLQMDYTRTWEEVDPTGALIQVWRFVVKVDLSGVAGVPPSACVTPSCVSPVGPHTTAFYYGYLDFASCNAVPGAAGPQARAGNRPARPLPRMPIRWRSNGR